MKAPLGVRVGQTASRQEGYETDVARGSQPGLHHCIAVVPPGTARMEIGPGVVRLGEAQLKEKKKKGKALFFSFFLLRPNYTGTFPTSVPEVSPVSLSPLAFLCFSGGAVLQSNHTGGNCM